MWSHQQAFRRIKLLLFTLLFADLLVGLFWGILNAQLNFFGDIINQRLEAITNNSNNKFGTAEKLMDEILEQQINKLQTFRW